MTPHSHDEWADHWAVRLEGGPLSAPDQAALARWLDADPANRARLSASCQFLTDLERELPAAVPAAVLSASWSDARAAVRTEPPAAPPRRSPRLVAILGGTAAALAAVWALMLGWGRGPFAPASPSAVTPSSSAPTLAVAAPRVQSLALTDGTRAELNVGTALNVDFRDAHLRTVRMERGEAVFSVAKDPHRPFIVETPRGRVRVTGTVFNVRLAPADQLEVTVLEGAVEVTPAPATAAVTAAPLQLEPGDQVTIEDRRVAVKRFAPEAARDVVAWRENRVVFDGVPLVEAVRRFRAFDERRCTFDPAVAQLRVGGRYHLDDLDGFLQGVAAALPVRVERRPDGALHLAPP